MKHVSLLLAALVVNAPALAYVNVGKAKIDRQISSQDLNVDLIELSDGSKCVLVRDPIERTMQLSCAVNPTPMK
jgi:hypothetical protein